MPLGFKDHSKLSLRGRGGTDSIQRVIIMAITELAILAGLHFLLYAAEETAPDHYVGSISLDSVEGGILFLLPTALVNVQIQFGF